jgi:hypothetical protein
MNTGQYNPYKPNPSDLIFLNWLEEYLSKEGVQDTEIWQALQKRLWPYHHPFLFSLKTIKNQLQRNSIQFLKSLGKKAFPSQFRLWLDNFIRLTIVRNSVRHIAGFKETNNPHGMIVLCIVKNAELYVKSFIEHYLSLGVKQIVFLDNESIDDTVAIAREYEYDGVIILQTKYKNPKYRPLMERYLVQNYVRDCLYVFAEVDELLDLPTAGREESKVSEIIA